MIRGILDRSKTATTSATTTDSAKQLPINSSSSGSTASESSGRPTSGSEDASGRGTERHFFRDSTVPIAKGLKSAGKIFRASANSVSGTPNHQQQQQYPPSAFDVDVPFDSHTHHHPQHSSRQTETGASYNSLSHSSSSHSGASSMATASEPRTAGKKCSLCGKNFNPLRRRYFCRVCTLEVCSNCSLKRKVDSSLEGAISIRICMACKMNTSAPQADYYDRAFSVASALHPGDDNDSVFGGDVFGDRASAASFMSMAPGASTRSTTTSSVTGGGTTPSRDTHVHFSSSASAAGGSARPKTPGNLRRTSSAASTHSMARSRRDSFGSLAASGECHMCMNEACGPMVDFAEVQYPAVEAKTPTGERFVRARSLDNERERLSSVRRIRRALTDAPALAQRFAQLCHMASIAAQSRIAVIALVDREDYFVVSETGLPPAAATVSRTLSLAAHTCRNGAPLVCSDLSADVRFAANPWRRDALHALFYAGIPLTLANGHTIGVIEVFDKNVRFACMDVVTQLQAVVRGLLKKFEEILASVATDAERLPPPLVPHQAASVGGGDEAIATAIAALERSTSYTEVKPSPVPPPPRSPARRPPAPPAPPTAPYTGPPATTGDAPPVAVAAPVVVTAVPEAAPATENDMELRLMELLSQTTSTQEQLRNQQGQMVHAITNHSKQITELAKQLERMESTLASKLDGVAPAVKDASTPEVAP